MNSRFQGNPFSGCWDISDKTKMVDWLTKWLNDIPNPGATRLKIPKIYCSGFSNVRIWRLLSLPSLQICDGTVSWHFKEKTWLIIIHFWSCSPRFTQRKIWSDLNHVNALIEHFAHACQDLTLIIRITALWSILHIDLDKHEASQVHILEPASCMSQPPVILGSGTQHTQWERRGK